MERQAGELGTEGGLMMWQTWAALGSTAVPFLPTPLGLGAFWCIGFTGETRRTIFCCLPSCDA